MFKNRSSEVRSQELEVATIHFSPRRSTKQKGSKQLGVTLVELMFAMTIMTTVTAVVIHFIFQSWGSQSLMEAQANLKTYSQNALSRVSNQLSQAKLLLNNDTLGQGYVAKINLTNLPPVIANSRLPDIRSNGALSPEKTCTVSPNNYFLSNSVGNSLLFVELVDSFSGFPSTMTDRRTLDVYRFTYYYLTDHSNNDAKPYIDYWKGAKTLKAMDLIEWHSVNYVDYQQLSTYLTAVSTADKSAITTALTAAGLTKAWDRTAALATAGLYDIGTGTATLNASAPLTYKIHMSATRLVSDGETVYSVAYNTNKTVGAAGYFPISGQVPYLYKPVPSPLCAPTPSPLPTASTAGDYSFPRGFEVVITGPNSGRSILMRLSMVAKGRHEMMAFHPAMMITYARDF